MKNVKVLEQFYLELQQKVKDDTEHIEHTVVYSISGPLCY